MLSHQHRFHGHGSLRYVYRHGTRALSPQLSLSYCKNSRRVHSRFTVVISKKVYKSAVKRNRLRRRIYEIIRLKLESIKKPYDVAITVFAPELLTLEPAELRQIVLGLLAKERLIE